jgi:hypothetical protein
MIGASLLGFWANGAWMASTSANGDIIRIDGGRSNVILDGEVFRGGQ